MSFISDYRHKHNIRDAQVTGVAAEAAFHSQPHLEKVPRSMSYVGRYIMGLRTRDIPKYIPENPECNLCNDDWFVWVRTGVGRKRTQKCKCRQEEAYA